MTGIILDAVLMLLLVAALGYGIRLEKKLGQLRAGQQAFASAVAELNTAAGRAESALASLRASGEEADLLHDRVLKARALKLELEALLARSPVRPSAEPVLAAEPSLSTPIRGPERSEPRLERMAPALSALAANHAAQERLNRARRSLDDDLFAA